MAQTTTKKKFNLSLSATITLLITIFVVLVSGVLGTILTVQSIEKMKSFVENKTLEMAATAATLLDGDALRDITADDIGSPAYNAAFNSMKAFKHSNQGTSGELAYIYACRGRGDGTFEFTIDPTENPAQFGEDLEPTPAIISAWNGTPAFDKEPFTDRWGTFYSAYAPVYASNNDITMLVGIDVWADWFNSMVWSNSASIIITASIAAVSGVLVGVIINLRVRRKFSLLSTEFHTLEKDVQTLIREIKQPIDTDEEEQAKESGDQVMNLRDQIVATQQEIKDYIRYTQKQAYVDALSGVGNRASYLEKVKKLDLEKPLAISIFDINGLKFINDTYGHEDGDTAIIEVAKLLVEVFGGDKVFRIGGDEFAVLLQEKSQEEAQSLFDSYRVKLKEFNNKSMLAFTLNVSQGIAFFDKDVDKTFVKAFNRADEGMYTEKEEFYKANPMLRKRYGH